MQSPLALSCIDAWFVLHHSSGQYKRFYETRRVRCELFIRNEKSALRAVTVDPMLTISTVHFGECKYGRADETLRVLGDGSDRRTFDLVLTRFGYRCGNK